MVSARIVLAWSLRSRLAVVTKRKWAWPLNQIQALTHNLRKASIIFSFSYSFMDLIIRCVESGRWTELICLVDPLKLPLLTRATIVAAQCNLWFGLMNIACCLLAQNMTHWGHSLCMIGKGPIQVFIGNMNSIAKSQLVRKINVIILLGLPIHSFDVCLINSHRLGITKRIDHKVLPENKNSPQYQNLSYLRPPCV
jgi:hypothetical protein